MTASIIQFKMTGLSSLLMNNAESMEEEGNVTKTRTKKELPEQEAEKRLYVMEDGKSLYIPSIAFTRSLWTGASYQKIGKDSARSRIQSAVFIMEEQTPLLSQNGNPITTDDYSIDSRYVVIKATKGRIKRYRPKIDNWSCILSLEVDTDYIDSDMVVQLFKKAGRVVGVLDFRPACTGPYGRYDCELYLGK